MNILVVEDRYNDMEHICQILAEISPESKLLKAGDASSAMKLICEEKIDLAMIDVDLPDESGFSLASKLRNMEEYRLLYIVFVTGTNENPLKAYKEYHCYDFIKKPYTREMFKKIMAPLIEGLSSKKAEVEIRENEKFKVVFLNSENEMHIVKTNEILYAEINGRYITLHLTNREITGIRMKLESLVNYINDESFVRCHKSFAVNTKLVAGIKKMNYRLWEIDFGDSNNGTKKCLMSKVYKENVEKCLAR